MWEYVVKIFDNGPNATWQAIIRNESYSESGPCASLNINRYTGDSEPQEIWFEKGWDSLVQDVVLRLSEYCGPLVIIPDLESKPKVITI